MPDIHLARALIERRSSARRSKRLGRLPVRIQTRLGRLSAPRPAPQKEVSRERLAYSRR